MGTVIHRPGGALGPFVESIWHAARGALGHDRELALPTGHVDIVIPLLQDDIVRFDGIESRQPTRLRGAVVGGAHDRFAVRGMAGPSAVIGVHFKPGGAAPFVTPALPELHNRTVELEALWGRAACDLRERLQAATTPARRIALLEAALVARLAGGDPRHGVDTMVARAVRALERDPAAARIDVVQRDSGLGPARFIRRFEAAVGLTPKRYARVIRFVGVLAAAAGEDRHDWAALAAAHGYFDQSHLIHEFKRLAGITPTAYTPLRADQPSHVALHAAKDAAAKNLQSAAGGGR